MGGLGGDGGGGGGGLGGGGESESMRSPHRQLSLHVKVTSSPEPVLKYFSSNAGLAEKNDADRHG